jgi:hypothetical protein
MDEVRDIDTLRREPNSWISNVMRRAVLYTCWPSDATFHYQYTDVPEQPCPLSNHIIDF